MDRETPNGFPPTVERLLDKYLQNPPLLEDFDDGSFPMFRNEGRTINSKSGEGVLVPLDSGELEDSKNTRLFVLASAIELLCSLVEGSPQKQQKLFSVIAWSLVRLGLLPSLLATRELESIRGQFGLALRHLLDQARQLIHDGIPTPGPATTSTLSLSPRKTPLNYGDRAELEFFMSRYRREFEEEECLGQGGFGKVFKARNKLDDCRYAVKQIAFNIQDSLICFKNLREVKMLAGLAHVNVVRYFGAWVEFESAPTSEPAVVPGPRIRELSLSAESDTHGSPLPRTVSSPSISFAHCNSHHPHTAACNLDSSTSGSGNGFWQERLERHKSESESRLTGTGSASGGDQLVAVDHTDFGRTLRRMLPLTRSLVLFVQMELCTMTLKQYLLQRNSALHTERTDKEDTQDAFWCVNVAFNASVIRQVLEALAYTHSRGLIHRDIKPGNVFLSSPETPAGEWRVRIGDFGLACSNQLDEPTVPISYDSIEEESMERHSAGVGTRTYSAPEQLNSSIYDSKVDLFSVGMIAFELFCPFQTYSEKLHTLNRVRMAHLPSEFQHRWPTESGIIRQLVQGNQHLRPSAGQLLTGNVFHSKDQRIRDLEATVRRQEEELFRLHAQLQSLESPTL